MVSVLKLSLYILAYSFIYLIIIVIVILHRIEGSLVYSGNDLNSMVGLDECSDKEIYHVHWTYRIMNPHLNWECYFIIKWSLRRLSNLLGLTKGEI